jgi:hypothetical protein
MCVSGFRLANLAALRHLYQNQCDSRTCAKTCWRWRPRATRTAVNCPARASYPARHPFRPSWAKSLNVGARRVRRAFFSLTRLHESHALSYEHSFPLFLRQGGVHLVGVSRAPGLAYAFANS